jgi:hypothetical protein
MNIEGFIQHRKFIWSMELDVEKNPERIKLIKAKITELEILIEFITKN